MTLEEIERIESAVYGLHGPMFPDPYDRGKYELEDYLNKKVIYYIKLEVSPEELEKKAEKRREEYFKRINEQQ